MEGAEGAGHGQRARRDSSGRCQGGARVGRSRQQAPEGGLSQGSLAAPGEGTSVWLVPAACPAPGPA